MPIFIRLPTDPQTHINKYGGSMLLVVFVVVVVIVVVVVAIFGAGVVVDVVFVDQRLI